MSYITGSSTEVLYSSFAQGTQLNTFTTEDQLQKTLPICMIPAGFFSQGGQPGKSLRVLSRGRLGTTGTPTFTFTARLLTSTTWSAGGIVLGSTAALTGGSAVTLAPWELDMHVGVRSLGVAGASTVVAMGSVRGQTAFSVPVGTIPAANTTPVISTIDAQVNYYLFLSVACGTSNAANLIQLEQLVVYGEN